MCYSIPKIGASRIAGAIVVFDGTATVKKRCAAHP
jgi:hypothetical protein